MTKPPDPRVDWGAWEEREAYKLRRQSNMILDVHKRNAIARAYLAGMAAKELAEENDISVPHVIMISKRHDRDRFAELQARRKAAAEANRLPPAPKREAERRVIRREPIARKVPRPGDRFVTSSGINAYVSRVVGSNAGDGVNHVPISLPYVSILGPMSRTLRKAR